MRRHPVLLVMLLLLTAFAFAVPTTRVSGSIERGSAARPRGLPAAGVRCSPDTYRDANADRDSHAYGNGYTYGNGYADADRDPDGDPHQRSFADRLGSAARSPRRLHYSGAGPAGARVLAPRQGRVVCRKRASRCRPAPHLCRCAKPRRRTTGGHSGQHDIARWLRRARQHRHRAQTWRAVRRKHAHVAGRAGLQGRPRGRLPGRCRQRVGHGQHRAAAIYNSHQLRVCLAVDCCPRHSACAGTMVANANGDASASNHPPAFTRPQSPPHPPGDSFYLPELGGLTVIKACPILRRTDTTVTVEDDGIGFDPAAALAGGATGL